MLRMSRKGLSRTFFFRLSLFSVCTFRLIYSVSLNPLDWWLWLRVITASNMNATLVVLGDVILVFIDNL